MAIRYTVYCKQSVSHVTPRELLEGVQIADLYTIAEFNDVPDEVIESALDQLRIENIDANGFRFYRLCYRPEGLRQIDVERCQTQEEVRGVVAEVCESLQEKNHPSIDHISSHLKDTMDIVAASFGSSEEEMMAPILASEVARWLAEKFDGLIRAADNSWWQLGAHSEYQPLQA